MLKRLLEILQLFMVATSKDLSGSLDPYIVEAANNHGLKPAVVRAVVEQESSFNPLATRYEPAFYQRYIIERQGGGRRLLGHVPPRNVQSRETEMIQRAISWGLMQVMGQVAREAGFKEDNLTWLLEPKRNLDLGCAHLARKLKIARRSFKVEKMAYQKALEMYNGSPSYPGKVLARLPKGFEWHDTA